MSRSGRRRPGKARGAPAQRRVARGQIYRQPPTIRPEPGQSWRHGFTGNIGYGIDQRTARFARRVTANVLRAFADGPAAAAYPAHDNLRGFREWPGDPIAAGHSLW